MNGDGENTPKNHHFVAQMHLQRFVDSDGMLWAYSKKSAKIFRATPKVIFAETHLYTSESSDGIKDTSLEAEFSELEGRASYVIDTLLAAAQAGSKLNLTTADRATWDSYFYLQWKRVPDMHRKVAPLANEAYLDQKFEEFRARGPEVAAEVDKLDTPKERKRLRQSGKVRAMRTTSGGVLNALASRGLTIYRIGPSDQGFAIGSLPILRGNGDLRDSHTPALLPISPQVAVGPGAAPSGVDFVELVNAEEIWQFNQLMARQSTTFAAREKGLIEKLVAALSAPMHVNELAWPSQLRGS
jgi:hypothetical protein